jgi:hypothetical protein
METLDGEVGGIMSERGGGGKGTEEKERVQNTVG